MAKTCGLTLLEECEKDPLTTTTYGVGELIRDAVNGGAKTLVICIGGSATNDGGTGMLEALGVKFIDGARGALTLKTLTFIDVSALDKRIKELKSILQVEVNPIRKATYERELKNLQSLFDPSMISEDHVTVAAVQQSADNSGALNIDTVNQLKMMCRF